MVETPATSASDETYDPAFFSRLVAVEDRHFWFRARNRVIAAITRQVAGTFAPGYSLLEVGCGTGNVLQVLEKVCEGGTVTGMDQSAEGLRFARQRTSCDLIEGDVRTARFETSFNIVGLFDVLEHIPDDVQVLSDLQSVLADNGMLLVTVPAHPSLWSYFDVASHHQRRYTRAGLLDTLHRAGYSVEYVTHFMAMLFPLMWLGRHVAARGSSAKDVNAADAYELATGELRVVPVVNDVLERMLRLETMAISNRRTLPFGPSLLAVARKRLP